MQYLTAKSEGMPSPVWVFSKKQYAGKITDATSLITNLRGYHLCGLPNKDIVCARQGYYSTASKYPLPFLLEKGDRSNLSIAFLASYTVNNFLVAPEMLNTSLAPRDCLAVSLDKVDASATPTALYAYACPMALRVRGSAPANYYVNETLTVEDPIEFVRIERNGVSETRVMPKSTIKISRELPRFKTGLFGLSGSRSQTGAPMGNDCITSTNNSYTVKSVADVRYPVEADFLTARRDSTSCTFASYYPSTKTMYANFVEGDITELVAFQTDGISISKFEGEKFDKHIEISPIEDTDGGEFLYGKRIKVTFDIRLTQLEV